MGSFHGVTGESAVADFGVAPNGTKYFAYPNSRRGQFWQDWLSGTRDGSGRGNYVELQIGPAPSQMQTFSLPANRSIEWTEYIMAMTGADATTLHGVSYPHALEVQRFLNTPHGITREDITQHDQHLRALASAPLDPSAIFFPGTPWGALEELRQATEQVQSRGYHNAVSVLI